MGAVKIENSINQIDPALSLIDNQLDEVLQKIVMEATTFSGFPISLVSLVMNQIQYFKAHVGLPLELAISRATDRCSSLCQFVVETGKPFIVEDTTVRPELPQDLIKPYNIISYFGFPVTVSGKVVGSLCLIDVKKNFLTEEIRLRMLELAHKASQHLQSLKKGMSGEQILLEKASVPAISEIRNILAALTLASGQSSHLSDQLNPLFFLLQEFTQKKLSAEEFTRGIIALQDTVRSYQKIPALLKIIQSSVHRMSGAIYGLEGALILKPSSMNCEIKDILNASENLSHHLTKLVGGVSWDSANERYLLKVPQNLAITLLGSLLTSISENALRANLDTHGILGHIEKVNDAVRIRLHFQGMPAFEWATLQSILSILACNCKAVKLVSDKECIELHLPIAA